MATSSGLRALEPRADSLSPQGERLEANGRPLGIGPVVDGAVDHANGMQTGLHGILDGKIDVPDREPALAVRAEED